MAFMEGLDNIANPQGGDERLGGGSWARDEDRSYGNKGNQTYDEWMQSQGYAKGSYGHNDGYLEWRQANTPEGQSFVYQGNEYTGTGKAKPKAAESVSESNKETITEGTDYSWVLGSPETTEVSSTTTDKSTELGGNTYSSLEEAAKNAPKYAKAGTSTGGTIESNPLAYFDFGQDEDKAGFYDENGKKITDPTELHKREDKATRDLVKDFNDLTGEIVSGNLTAKDIKRINADLQNTPENKNLLSKASNAVTNFLSLGTKPNMPGYDVPVVKDAGAYLQAIQDGANPKKLSELAEKSALGIDNAGLEYYKLTGDTNNNPYATKVEEKLTNALNDVMTGKASQEDFDKYADKLLSKVDIGTFFETGWDALKSNYARSAVMAAGSGIGALVGQGAAKFASTHPKVIGKILEKNAEKIAQNLPDEDLAVFEKVIGVKSIENGTVKPVSRETLKKFLELSGKGLQNSKPGQRVQAERIVDIFRRLASASDAAVPTVLEQATKELRDNVGKGTAAIGATAVGASLANQEAQAAPTGTFDAKGRMIDSKEIVKERLANPYPGEDAVELKSREGVVTVSPREAVLIGEAENLTPTQNYTDEVKKAAEGSEVYNSEGDVVYNGDEPEKIQPEIVNTNWFDKTVDVIQAILGGRDQNNDRTITAQEWYTSTLKKPVEAVRDFAHLPDLKSKLNHLKDVANNYIERIGIALESSAPAVIDLSTGKVEVVDKEVPYTEDLKEAAKTAVIDSLPKWSDDSKTELVKEAIADGASSVLGEYAYGAGNFIGIQAAKAAGSYVASTVKEICHLMGYDMDNDQVGALNMLITNVVGIFVAPTSTIVRDLSLAYGGVTREGIESIYKNEPIDSVIIPLDKESKDWQSEPVSINDKVTKDSEADYSADFGTTTEISDDPNSTIDDKYSGYVEQAKNSNLAKNYNYGMEQKVNETVSDKDVKGYIVTLYSKEPEWMRKAIAKVLAAHSESEWR